MILLCFNHFTNEDGDCTDHGSRNLEDRKNDATIERNNSKIDSNHLSLNEKRKNLVCNSKKTACNICGNLFVHVKIHTRKSTSKKYKNKIT
jgi:hypothetical protein